MKQIIGGRPPKETYKTEEVGLETFNVNDVDEAGSGITYVGKEDKTGNYWIIKVDESANPTTLRHATKANNSETSYSSAWSNRVSLTYNNFNKVF